MAKTRDLIVLTLYVPILLGRKRDSGLMAMDAEISYIAIIFSKCACAIAQIFNWKVNHKNLAQKKKPLSLLSLGARKII